MKEGIQLRKQRAVSLNVDGAEKHTIGADTQDSAGSAE